MIKKKIPKWNVESLKKNNYRYHMLKIGVKRGNIVKALKEYKGKVIKSRQMREINSRKEYEKPSAKNRRTKQKGIYKEKKRRENY